MTPDAELIGLLGQIQKANAGAGILTKDALYGAAKRIAKRLRTETDSSDSAAFVRLFVNAGSPGYPVYRALQSAPGRANIAKAAPKPKQPDDDGDDDEGNETLEKLITAHMAKHDVSRPQATKAMLATARGVRAYQFEKNARLTKALGR